MSVEAGLHASRPAAALVLPAPSMAVQQHNNTSHPYGIPFHTRARALPVRPLPRRRCVAGGAMSPWAAMGPRPRRALARAGPARHPLCRGPSRRPAPPCARPYERAPAVPPRWKASWCRARRAHGRGVEHACAPARAGACHDTLIWILSAQWISIPRRPSCNAVVPRPGDLFEAQDRDGVTPHRLWRPRWRRHQGSQGLKGPSQLPGPLQPIATRRRVSSPVAPRKAAACGRSATASGLGHGSLIK
jgi:hypothetical protein